jgi:hypothetical protein
MFCHENVNLQQHTNQNGPKIQIKSPYKHLGMVKAEIQSSI